MAVNRTPVLKRCRSLDLDPTFLGYDKKSKRTLIRRSRKMSEYGTQLREKQKAKFIYGVLEKPFRNYYDKADMMKGMTGENLMIMLERRLDNGKIINIPSYQIKAGDVVEVKEASKNIQRFKDIQEITAGRLTPEWVDVDKENLKGTVSALPRREQIDVPVDEMLIVELYSK